MALVPEGYFSTPQDDLNLDLDEALDNAVDFLSSSDVEKLLSSSSPANARRKYTPIDTPPSSSSQQSVSSSSRKHVDWTPFTHWKFGWASSISLEGGKENACQSVLKNIQPSKERRLERSKSILKASKSLGNEQEGEMQEPKSWGQVLESSCTKLRTNHDPSMNIDTWRHLQQWLTEPTNLDLCLHEVEYNNLLTYARRDIQYVDGKVDDGPPNQLPNAALRFLSVFVRLRDVKQQLQIQECTALVDVTITALGTSDLSKSLSKCHLDFLSRQQFSPEVMTPERVRKTIEVLQPLEKHYASSCIVLDRIKVYLRFIQQYPEAMAVRASYWLGNVVRATLSSEAAVFRLAVDAAFHAARELGHRKEVARAMETFLTERIENDNTNLEVLCNVLSTKADPSVDVTQAMLVPKLVSAILLFLRARGPYAALGGDYGRFLSILKPYFVRNNAKLAPPAYNALSWLIVAETGNGRWPKKSLARLRSAIEPQLTKFKKALDFSKGIPRSALSTYLTLLYCSFHPDMYDEHTRSKWGFAVAEMISGMLDKSETHASLACDILCTLFASDAIYNPHQFDDSKRSWSEPLLELKDLPSLNPGWIRANLQVVLRLVDQVLRSQDGSEHSMKVWSALIDAVAMAGSNDIVVTKETKNAITQITNFLTALWNRQIQVQRDENTFLHQMNFFGRLLNLFFTKLGSPQERIGILAEKFLRAMPGDDGFEVAPTPSHRPSMPLQSPVSHFLGVLLHAPLRRDSAQKESMELAFELSRDIATHFCQLRTTRVGRLSFLSALAANLSKAYQGSTSQKPVKHLEKFAGHILGLALETFDDPTLNQQYAPAERLWDVYEQVVTIFAVLATCTTVSAESLSMCYEKINGHARTEAGATGAFAAFQEPSAIKLLHFLQDVELSGNFGPRKARLIAAYAEVIVRTATKPGNLRALLKALEKLGRTITTPASPNFDKLHQMADRAILFGYRSIPGEGGKTMRSLTGLVDAISCNLTSHNMLNLHSLKKGLAVLVKDKEERIFGPGGDEKCTKEVLKLWQIILNELKTINLDAQKCLSMYEELISAGLTSVSSHIVNESIVYWNERFGELTTLTYPALIAKALRQLQPLVDDLRVLSLLPEENDTDPDTPLVIRTTESVPIVQTTLAPPTPLPRRQVPKITVSPRPAVPRRTAVTPKTKPKAKLRHDDSQIQFEPIASSPSRVNDLDLLTEHQREVLERQRGGTNTQALFVEVSSPGARRIRELSVHLPNEVEQAVEAPATPTLAPAMDDGLLSSSPVVQSVKRRQDFTRRTPPAVIDLGQSLLDEFLHIPSSPPAAVNDPPASEALVSATVTGAPKRIQSPGLHHQPSLLDDAGKDMCEEESQPVDILAKDVAAPAELLEPSAVIAFPQDEVVESTIDNERGPPPIPEVEMRNTPAEQEAPHANLSTSFSTVADEGAHHEKLTASRSSRVLETFIEADGQMECESQAIMKSIEAGQDNSSGRKRRRKQRTSFAPAKKRKMIEDDLGYPSIIITPMKAQRYPTPEGMLERIDVVLPEFVETEEVQIPATAKKAGKRSKKSMDDHDNRLLDEDRHEGTQKRKRGRPSRSSQDVLSQNETALLQPVLALMSNHRSTDVVESTKSWRRSSRLSQNNTEDKVNQIQVPSSKRRRTRPSTPTSRSSSVLFVQVTPGDATGRRASMTTRTDTPEIEQMMALSQQDWETDPLGMELRTSMSPPKTSGKEEDFVPDSQDVHAREIPMHLDDVDSVIGDLPTREEASRAPPSEAGGQDTQRSSSSFSAASFLGVISRFAEQAKIFIAGGRREEASEAVDKIVREARKRAARR